MPYKHTQFGQLIVYTLVGLVIYFGVILYFVGFEPGAIVVLLLILALVASFATLTVYIDGNHLGIKFGYGIYGKKFALNEIASIKIAKHHWYQGWGIRYWAPKKMWIFNVSGFEAVDLTMKSGKIYRIGTDEPQALVTALEQFIK